MRHCIHLRTTMTLPSAVITDTNSEVGQGRTSTDTQHGTRARNSIQMHKKGMIRSWSWLLVVILIPISLVCRDTNTTPHKIKRPFNYLLSKKKDTVDVFFQPALRHSYLQRLRRKLLGHPFWVGSRLPLLPTWWRGAPSEAAACGVHVCHLPSGKSVLACVSLSVPKRTEGQWVSQSLTCSVGSLARSRWEYWWVSFRVCFNLAVRLLWPSIN